MPSDWIQETDRSAVLADRCERGRQRGDLSLACARQSAICERCRAVPSGWMYCHRCNCHHSCPRRHGLTLPGQTYSSNWRGEQSRPNRSLLPFAAATLSCTGIDCPGAVSAVLGRIGALPHHFGSAPRLGRCCLSRDDLGPPKFTTSGVACPRKPGTGVHDLIARALRRGLDRLYLAVGQGDLGLSLFHAIYCVSLVLAGSPPGQHWGNICRRTGPEAVE
jgi:hypothetical protein